MQGGVPTLRPLGVGEIIDVAFRLYRRNFGRLVAVAAVVYVPLGFVSALVFGLVGSVAGFVEKPETLQPAVVLGAAAAVIPIVVLGAVAYLLVYSATAVAVSREYLGHDISVGTAYAHVWPRIGSLIGTWLAVAVLVGLGTVLCFIPGIYLAIALIFAVPVVVLEGKGVAASLGRSMELVRGLWLRVFVTLTLLGLIVAVIQLALLWPLSFMLTATLQAASPAAAQAVYQFISNLASMVLLPLTTTGLIVLYYDLRVRKEGFDLQLLAEQIGAALNLPPASPTQEWQSPTYGRDDRGAELVPPPDKDQGEEGTQGPSRWDDDEPQF